MGQIIWSKKLILAQVMLCNLSMTNQNTAIFGIFSKRAEISDAITLLKKVGFGSQDISILFPEEKGAQDFPQVQKNQLRNGAIIGAIIGIILGGTFGAAVSSGVFPGFTFVGNTTPAIGPVLTVLVSVLLGGLAGAACGTLVGIGTPDPAGKRYGQYVHAGGILLSVKSEIPEKLVKAQFILDEAGAQDINYMDEADGWKEVVHEERALFDEDFKEVRTVNLPHI